MTTTTEAREQPAPAPARSPVLEVFGVASRLGLTSFGGPVAHLGYFRTEYVTRRRWLDDAGYADLVALCQFLPGPASSQVGIAIGTMRAGLLGGAAAWVGFTLPSAIALVLFSYGLNWFDVSPDAGWLHGLKVAAVAVVAFAVWGMARTLSTGRERATITILAAVAALAWQTAPAQVLIIAIAGLVGWRLFTEQGGASPVDIRIPIGRRTAIVAWALFFGMLAGLPLARQVSDSHPVAVFDSFYRTGSLVFGGGHVVLPLLQAEVVPPGWLTVDQFTTGYGAAQAVPGPLFTFAAYLGAAMGPEPNGVPGATLTLVAIFLPSFLMLMGTLPMWGMLRGRPGIQGGLRGVNAAVVGLLLAALYDPVWTSAVHDESDFALALAAFGLLVFWKVPPWLVVAFAAAGGAIMAAV